jgi:CRISPR-associated protein Cst1
MKAELNSTNSKENVELKKELTVQNTEEFYWTGHPFVDAGLAFILLYIGKQTPKEIEYENIKDAISFASNLYSKPEFAKYLTRIFRNNNPILMINPSMRRFSTPNKLEDSLSQLFNLIPLLNEENSKCQYCGFRRKISGMELRQVVPSKDKSKPKEVCGDVFPLLGTGGMRNFFPFANSLGADICASCLFLSQMMPLSTYAIQNKKGTVIGIFLIHAYPFDKMLEFSVESINHTKENSLFSDARGFRRPENFFFKKLIEITRKVESGSSFWKNTTVTLYYFINGNRSGEQWVDIMYIPTPVLKFIAFAGEMDYNGWKNILNRGWLIKKSKNKTSFGDLEKGYSNRVYSKLLNEEIILPYFLNIQKKEANAKWRLLEFYCLEVLGLDKDTLEFVKDVGDKIIGTVESLEDNQLRKTIRELENAKRLYQFENFFIRLEKIRQQNGIPNSLLTFDEFSTILTGYGEEMYISWYIVKNLLLFRIYEKLHNRLMKADSEEKDEETENEMPFGGE